MRVWRWLPKVPNYLDDLQVLRTCSPMNGRKVDLSWNVRQLSNPVNKLAK